MSLLATTI